MINKTVKKKDQIQTFCIKGSQIHLNSKHCKPVNVTLHEYESVP